MKSTALSLPALSLLAVSLLAGCHVGGGDQSWTVEPEGLEGIDVRLSSGAVDVVPTDSALLTIAWSGGGIGNEKVAPEPERRDAVLLFDARCGDACGGDVTVYLPAGLDVSATVERGDVWIELDERADVRACAAAGAVDLVVPAGPWDMSVDVGAGGLYTSGVTHDPRSADRLEACVAAGDVWITGR